MEFSCIIYWVLLKNKKKEKDYIAYFYLPADPDLHFLALHPLPFPLAPPCQGRAAAGQNVKVTFH